MGYQEIREALSDLGEAVGWRARKRERDMDFYVLCRQVDESNLNINALCRAHGVRTVLDASREEQAPSESRRYGAWATPADARAWADWVEKAIADLRSKIGYGLDPRGRAGGERS